jgi:hypothetical protein
MAAFCEYGNEFSGFIKEENFFDRPTIDFTKRPCITKLNDYLLSRKSRSYLVCKQ